MKRLALVAVGALIVAVAPAQADEATEREIIKTIMDENAEIQKTGVQTTEIVSKDGSLEFWSSGGLLHEVTQDDSPLEFESFTVKPKHITVITLVPGEIAVAQYYSEGTMDFKEGTDVSNYLTRATQVLVKEGGKWKVRAAHWSPIAGGSGTTQTSLD